MGKDGVLQIVEIRNTERTAEELVPRRYNAGSSCAKMRTAVPEIFHLFVRTDNFVTDLPADPGLDSLREVLQSAPALVGKELPRAVRRCRWLAEGTSEQVTGALKLLAAHGAWSTPGEVAFVEGCGTFLQQRAREGGDYQSTWNDDVAAIYRALPAGKSPPHALLAWLAEATEFAPARKLFLELLAERPPLEDAAVAAVFGPLFQRRQASAVQLFPQLFELQRYPSLAAAVYDLANYLFRSGWTSAHPSAGRVEVLQSLLGTLTMQLEKMVEVRGENESAVDLSQQVGQTVALVVALCDALALIGDPSSIGKLKRVLDLPHRRICTEAAAALTRLGDEEGKKRLLQMAEEPVARLRVLEYCSELNLLSQIEPKFATPVAQAESSLCIWLAEPTQFGLPPTEIELVDRREMRWPSYDQPLECFLFRFTYRFTVDEADRSYSNVGIAGPLPFAFAADLADLPPDDIYAAFAGYQAEHADILEVEVDRLSASEKLETERLKRRLHDAGFANIEPQFMGYFFNEKALVATCTREGVPGAAVADFEDLLFFPARNGPRSLGPREAYYIYKGRRLLKTFNRS